MITLKYLLTREDYKNFYVYVTWSSPERKRKRILSYGKQVLFSLVIIGVLLYFDVFMINKGIGYMMIGYVLLTMVFSLISTQVRMTKAADSFIEDPLNATTFTEHEVHFSEQGVMVKTDLHSTESRWAAFVKKEETAAYYYLFYNSLDALIIPKKVFRSQEEKQSFEKLLKSNLSIDAEIAALTRS